MVNMYYLEHAHEGRILSCMCTQYTKQYSIMGVSKFTTVEVRKSRATNLACYLQEYHRVASLALYYLFSSSINDLPDSIKCVIVTLVMLPLFGLCTSSVSLTHCHSHVFCLYYPVRLSTGED